MRIVTRFVVIVICLLVVVPGAVLAQRETWAPRAVITLTFDDAYADAYNVAFPILRQHNIRATVFIVTSYIGKLPDRLSLQNLRVLQSAGWEIGSHTVTHKRLTQLTSDQILYELKSSKEWLLSHGLYVRSLAFPYGVDNAYLRQLSMQFYDVTRTTSSLYLSYYSVPTDNCIRGIGMPADHSLTFRYIDNAIAAKSWLVLYMHSIAPDGTIADNGQDLHRIADYIAQKVSQGQLEVATFIGGFLRYNGDGAIR